MKMSLTATLVGASLLLVAPAFAQTRSHAGHHPGTPTTAPASSAATPADAAKPSPMRTMAMPSAKGTAHGGMMAGGKMMTPAMMKKCMHGHAKHQCQRAMRRHRH